MSSKAKFMSDLASIFNQTIQEEIQSTGWGIAQPNSITPYSGNIDDLKTSGVYSVEYDEPPYKLSKKGICVVTVAHDGAIKQTWHSTIDGSILQRTFRNILWSDWDELVTGSILADPDNGLVISVKSLSSPVYNTVADVQNSVIADNVTTLSTNGYYEPDDGGGAKYELGFEGPGAIMSADGQWWRPSKQIYKPRMFGAIGDGSTLDQTAFTQLSEFLATRPGSIVSLDQNATYRINQWHLDSCTDISIKANGAKFINNTGTSANTPFLILGTGCSLDFFKCTIPHGVRRDRVVVLQGNHAKLYGFDIVSEGQQNNESDEDDAAISLIGSNQTLGDGTVTNYDRACRYACTDSIIGHVTVVSYKLAHWMDNTNRTTFKLLSARATSPNATSASGENGCLFTDATNCDFDMISIEDSGEHGVRFGGVEDGNSFISIGRMKIHNSGSGDVTTPHGGCGLKIRTESASIKNRHIYIGSVGISDCGNGGTYGINKEGILIERSEMVYIGHADITKFNKSHSCNNGIRVNSSVNVTIASGNIDSTVGSGVVLENSDDGGTTLRPMSNIEINANLSNIGNHALMSDISGIELGHITVDINASNVSRNGFMINESSPSTFNGPFKCKGNLYNISGSPVTGTAIGNHNDMFFDYSYNGTLN